jgi:hypothetical protein
MQITKKHGTTTVNYTENRYSPLTKKPAQTPGMARKCGNALTWPNHRLIFG